MKKIALGGLSLLLMLVCIVYVSAIDSLSVKELIIGFPIAMLCGYTSLRLCEKVLPKELMKMD